MKFVHCKFPSSDKLFLLLYLRAKRQSNNEQITVIRRLKSYFAEDVAIVQNIRKKTQKREENHTSIKQGIPKPKKRAADQSLVSTNSKVFISK